MAGARAAARLILLAAASLAAHAVFAEEAASPAVTPPVAEALRLIESGDSYQQQLGLLRLEALRDPSIAPLLSGYANSKNADLRAATLRALAAIQGPAAVPLLLERMRTDKSAQVRRAAILGVEPHVLADAEALPALIARLRDRDATVRMAAVDVVSRINDPMAREAVITRYKREGKRDVRRVLEMAMKRIGAR